MFENLSEFVGYAMHDDRMLRARKDARVAEAGQAQPPSRGKIGAACRATLAQGLLALATRIAPMVTRPETGTLAPAP